jgi:2-polyprenyl-3-methyl-5-hydroxy-6-metoxy-1,4-benzoquinol methylase
MEVGAGAMLLSGYLVHRGYKLCAIEPIGIGFSFLSALRTAVLAHYKGQGMALNWHDEIAENLTPHTHGEFAFIFSINVMEHIDDARAALGAMMGCLQRGGQLMIHCPNYTIPYEPHFGALLVPCAPALNARLYKAKIAQDPQLWQSLNFIRYGQLKRWVSAQGGTMRARGDVLYQAFTRIETDPTFAARLPHWIKLVHNAANRLGLLGVFKALPAQLQSPMEVLIAKD